MNLITCIILLLLSLPFAAAAQSESASAALARQLAGYQPAKQVHRHRARLQWSLNPPVLAARILLFGYQRVLSPQLKTNCPYNPSCSEFARQSIAHWGLLAGSWMAADRLMRCSYCAIRMDKHIQLTVEKISDPITDYSH
jgi:putative component of membrane protein insertase Oxa1/YidC/SpoIIIJ protein YidD